MEYKELGKTGEKISEIGIGTWKMPVDSSDAVKAIRKAVSLGIDFVDTAEMYGNEEMVGRALAGIDGIKIATKVSPHNFRPDDVIKACSRSLAKLKIKEIFLYQLHWPNHSVPIGETMHAMEQLQKEGKIRHIGVSNFDAKEFEAAQAAMKRSQIVSNQIEYSILVRYIERELLEFCQKNKITIIAYSPLARGTIFSEKYKDLTKLLGRIAANHSKSIAQVALNWLINKKNVVAIPKATDERHVVENAGASGWKLTKEEQEELSNFFSRINKRPYASFLWPVIKRHGIWSKLASGKQS